MADNDKGFFTSSYDFFISHWGEILTLGHLAGGWLKGSMSADAPETAKVVAGAMGMSAGGKGDPSDEAFLKWIKLELKKLSDGKVLHPTITAFTQYAFQLNHPEKWVRERGRDAFEDWRVIVYRMGSEDKLVARDYVAEFTRDMVRDYMSECRKASVRPLPFDHNNPEHRIAQQVAFDNAIEQLKSEGTHVPTGTEAALLIQLKNVATRMGPQAFTAGKVAFDKAKAAADKLYQHAKDHGPDYVKKGWEQTKETAAAHADWMEQHATERNRQDANLGRFDRFLNKLLPF